MIAVVSYFSENGENIRQVGYLQKVWFDEVCISSSRDSKDYNWSTIPSDRVIDIQYIGNDSTNV